MSEQTRVTASEFSRNFGRYQDEALSGKIVTVTSHGRVIGGFLSARELEHYESLKRREVQVFKVGELPNDVIEEIQSAQYGITPE